MWTDSSHGSTWLIASPSTSIGNIICTVPSTQSACCARESSCITSPHMSRIQEPMLHTRAGQNNGFKRKVCYAAIPKTLLFYTFLQFFLFCMSINALIFLFVLSHFIVLFLSSLVFWYSCFSLKSFFLHGSST